MSTSLSYKPVMVNIPYKNVLNIKGYFEHNQEGGDGTPHSIPPLYVVVYASVPHRHGMTLASNMKE